MAERGWIEPIVERVVAQVLESQALQLRAEIVRRVAEEVGATPAAEVAANAASAALARAVAEIQAGSTQREILRALLDSCAGHARRVALFVVRGGNATGWQGRGFSSNDAVKDFALDVNAPAVVKAISDHSVVNATAGEMDPRFLQEFGAPANGEAHLLPLLLKDKVAALLYADGGTEGSPHLDAGSLELLVLFTSAWLEIHSLRKQAQKAATADTGKVEPQAAPPVTALSYSDPFAMQAPSQAMAAAAGAQTSAPAMTAVAEPEPALAEPEGEQAVATAVTETAPATPAASDEEQQIHQKAQRFARLLVDEIKLYNQAKVAEGRKNKDLYDRLKEAIEKSRGTYQKRYGNTIAASGDYFQHELIRSLAEDDISIMGANFQP